jgi:hypothetical protein
MNKLSFVLVILVIILYVRYNLKVSPQFELIQIHPSQLTPDLLNEKNPIVLVDTSNEEEPMDIIRKSLRYMYLYMMRVLRASESSLIIKNKAKCLFVFSSSEPIEIEVIHPKYTDKDYVSVPIKLSKNQCLILPLFWKYKIVYEGKKEDNVNCVAVHDFFSCMYQTCSTLL